MKRNKQTRAWLDSIWSDLTEEARDWIAGTDINIMTEVFGIFNSAEEVNAACNEWAREEESKMKYMVNFYDPETGATSPIDNIEESAGYTAEQYIEDCKSNADDDWNAMLASGTVTLVEVDE